MSPNEQILRSFLVSVGFRIDDNAFRRFQEGMGKVDSKAMLVAKSVTAVAVAAEAMVHIFSMSMEKLYYASQRTRASVKNIQALEYGAQQIGVSADVARGSLEAMAGALRMDYGLRGLLDQILGRSTAGEDQVEVMLGLVQKLSTMPHREGAWFAQMFGMDEQTYLMYKQKMPELLAAMERRRKLAKESGIDAEEAAKNAREYMNLWRDILERIEVVSQKMASDLLPPFREMARLVDSAVEKMASFAFDPETVRYAQEMRDALFGIATSLGQIADKLGVIDFASKFSESVKQDMLAFVHLVNALLALLRGDTAAAKESLLAAAERFKGPVKKDPNAPVQDTGIRRIGGGPSGPGATMGEVEAGSKQRYEQNLSMIQAEIKRARTDAQRSVLLEELARMKSPASASLLAQASAYQGYAPSWQAGAGAAATSPSGGPITLHSKTDIHVNGAGDPAAVARNVAGAQRNVGADIVRNLEGVVR